MKPSARTVRQVREGLAGELAVDRVSALVINHDGGERVLRTVAALASQSVPFDRILVVDNASSDQSPERLRERFPKIRVERLSKQLGLPAARNVGLRLAASDLVLCVDHDVYLEPDALEALVRAQRETGASVTVPRLILAENGRVQADGAEAHFIGTMTLRNTGTEPGSAPSSRCEVGACQGACLLVDREQMLAEGGFDELFYFYFEDLELSLRLRSRGLRLVCEPAALAIHDRGRGTPGLSFRGHGTYPRRRAYLTIRHRWLAMLIHYRLRTFAVLAPALIAYEVAALVSALSRGWIAEWTGAGLWIAKNAGTIAERRRGCRKARTVGDRDLLSNGPLPFADGFLRTKVESISAGMLSKFLDIYWSLAKKWVA